MTQNQDSDGKKASEWWSEAAVAEQAVYDSLQETNCFKFRNENDHTDQSEWAIDID